MFKRVYKQAGEGQALHVVAAMRQGRVVDLDERIALSAARVSLELRLPLADSVVLATARAHSATLWTQDEDFKGLPDVQYRKKKS